MSPLAEPPADLAAFPAYRLLPSYQLCRIHRHDRGPWWFSHDGTGRFDLAHPYGTCYLAEEPLGAFVEVFRDTVLVPEIEVAARRLSFLQVDRELRLADCTSRKARSFGVTEAIHSSADYALTQRWTTAIATAGFGGVRYLLSHDPAQHCIGVTLFGSAGNAAWPITSTAPIDSSLVREAERHFGIRVLRLPG